MNQVIIIIVLILLVGAGGGAGGYFFASGRCATKETGAISDAVDTSNTISTEITEHTTKVDKEENDAIREVIGIKYVKPDPASCPLRNTTQFMRDVYSASTGPEVQQP